jgi:hypothetical protein
MFDEVQLRIGWAVEGRIAIELVIPIHAHNISATTLHALEQQEILRNVLVNQVERQQRMP